DYQLGGDYEPPPGVDVVARDSTSEPAPGLYNICYVNGFQTQPGEGDDWLDEHPELVLHDDSGAPVTDPGWPDEFLLDTSSVERRSGIADRLAPVLAACDAKGFDAVEIDNLDSWTRSDDALTIDDNIAMAAAYAEQAHSLGLAIAQKNGAGSSHRFRDEVGFDFVVSEQCMRYDECAEYLDVYDGLVFDIEYPADDGGTSDFAAACATAGRPESMILRDLDLAPAGEPGYLRETC
ncbi:MAG: endo alpha-1,4 polygalactosaminidase, partial [Rhodoglobus sp.]